MDGVFIVNMRSNYKSVGISVKTHNGTRIDKIFHSY